MKINERIKLVRNRISEIEQKNPQFKEEYKKLKKVKKK